MSYQNDAYRAEQFNDGLQNDFDDRSEDMRSLECETCNGTGIEKLSDCCAANVVNKCCEDCGHKCIVEKFECTECKGEGEI